MPIFQPDKLDADYLDQSAQFDAGIGYLFERGRKRQHRLQAAKDQTAVVRSLVTDNERQLVFGVSQQFVDVRWRIHAGLCAKGSRQLPETVDISKERFRAAT